jgi:hypothetical protein
VKRDLDFATSEI